MGELGVFGLLAVMVPEAAWPQARALVEELALGSADGVDADIAESADGAAGCPA